MIHLTIVTCSLLRHIFELIVDWLIENEKFKMEKNIWTEAESTMAFWPRTLSFSFALMIYKIFKLHCVQVAWQCNADKNPNGLGWCIFHAISSQTMHYRCHPRPDKQKPFVWLSVYYRYETKTQQRRLWCASSVCRLNWKSEIIKTQINNNLLACFVTRCISASSTTLPPIHTANRPPTDE